ncbi:hypothetical protein [Faecalimicrobium sp. JNUCC 81]
MVVRKAKFIRRFHEMDQRIKNLHLGMSKELQAIFTIDNCIPNYSRYKKGIISGLEFNINEMQKGIIY